MVIIKVYNDSGILSVFWSQTSFTIFRYRMMVGIVINGPVKFNTFPDLIREKILLISLDIISDEVSDHQLIIVSGKKNMGEEIQFGANKVKRCYYPPDQVVKIGFYLTTCHLKSALI